jgi:hypothetical protein
MGDGSMDITSTRPNPGISADVRARAEHWFVELMSAEQFGPHYPTFSIRLRPTRPIALPFRRFGICGPPGATQGFGSFLKSSEKKIPHGAFEGRFSP